MRAPKSQEANRATLRRFRALASGPIDIQWRPATLGISVAQGDVWAIGKQEQSCLGHLLPGVMMSELTSPLQARVTNY